MMQMKGIWTISCIAFLSIIARASTEVSMPQVLAINLEHRLNESGTGGYNLLLNAIKDSGVAFDLHILPVRRLHRIAKDNQNSCLFPVTIEAMHTYEPAYRSQQFIASDAIDRVGLYVFTAPDRPVIKDAAELAGKRVGAWKGRNSLPLIRSLNIEPDESDEESNQLMLLNYNRIDALIGFSPDVAIAAEKLNLPVPVHDSALRLIDEQDAAMVCYDTPANRVFIARFNAALQEFKHSGQLVTMLGKFAQVSL